MQAQDSTISSTEEACRERQKMLNLGLMGGINPAGFGVGRSREK